MLVVNLAGRAVMHLGLRPIAGYILTDVLNIHFRIKTYYIIILGEIKKIIIYNFNKFLLRIYFIFAFFYVKFVLIYLDK